MLEDLPDGVAARLRALKPLLHRRVLDTIRTVMSAQGRSLTGGQGRGLVLGVETAVDAFVEAAGSSSPDLAPSRAVFTRLGRTEFREGHRVDALRTILTAGGRDLWAFLVAQDLPPAALYVLASALFGYVDELAGAAVEGYLDEQEKNARDWDTVRRRLITLLVQPDPPGGAALQAAADAARWPLPGTVAVVSVEGTDAEHLARTAGNGVIATVIDDATRMVVPSPGTAGRLARVAAVLAGRRAALGPAVALASARLSYRISRRALRILPGDGLIRCDDRMLELVTGWEPGLMDRLADRELAAAGQLREPELQTLHAWLREQGQVVAAAAALHAHPQTVRYRMRKIRRAFGAVLDDPDARLRLELALRHRLAVGHRGDATGSPTSVASPSTSTRPASAAGSGRDR
ncbi:helix-turn-helix domain-containing protein [Couchioplanes azureus]|uniref:helix-turn-helix domain-containing protein n=1 Tax=Couchioplanes caeruleus TaxID=56438 RepID=UPI0016705BD9|nr:helix-turn-helix domain-containing protein [Couchioplanes caeruleus]GGQ62024.1 Fis family transcriptional regulator [Couchioplanes caeruleus subsp. azureus]